MRIKTIYKCFLITLIKNNPNSWFSKFEDKYPLIYRWIVKNTVRLSEIDFNFRINTRVNWIINNRIDFPKCEYCNEYIQIWKHKNIPVTHQYPRFCKLHAHCNEISISKIKNTLLNMSQEHWDNSLKKRINTCLTKYGCENISQLKETTDKITNSISSHYGVKRYSQTEEWKQETIESNKIKYGCEWYSQTNDYHNAVNNTLHDRYGENIVNVFQLNSVKEKINKTAYLRYRYKGIIFDSAPELAYYIWLIDHKIKFRYHPDDIKFKYITKDQKIHYYFPDFLLIDSSQLIEIKGEQFFTKDGLYINPYDKQNKRDSISKYRCMIENNVKIMRQKEYSVFVKYVNHKYGKNFIKSCKQPLTNINKEV